MTVFLITSIIPVGSVIADQEADTNVENVPPEVIDIDTPQTGQTLDPAISNEIEVTVSDDNTLSDIEEIEIVFYRNDTESSSTPDLRDTYVITYDATDDTVDLSPTDETETGTEANVEIIDSLGPLDEVEGSVTLDFTPKEYAAPSTNTINESVNDLFWVAEVTVTDSASQSGFLSDTGWDMNQRLNLVIDSSDISATGVPGETVRYSPDLDFRNDGNVESDIDYSATNQTTDDLDPDGDPIEDVIPADALSISDNEDEETFESYSTESQVFDANIGFDESGIIYNSVTIPEGLQDASYSGTVSYGNVESGAT